MPFNVECAWVALLPVSYTWFIVGASGFVSDLLANCLGLLFCKKTRGLLNLEFTSLDSDGGFAGINTWGFSAGFTL